MPTLTFDSELGRGVPPGGTGSDGIVWTPPSTGTSFHSALGSIFFVGRDAANRHNGFHRFRVTGVPAGAVITAATFRFRSWFGPLAQSFPAPVFSSGPEWRFDQGWDVFDQSLQLDALHQIRTALSATYKRTDWTLPTIAGNTYYDVPLDTEWIDTSKFYHDLEIEDISGYTSGWRYYIGQCEPFFAPAQLEIEYADPLITVCPVVGSQDRVSNVIGSQDRESSTVGNQDRISSATGNQDRISAVLGNSDEVSAVEGSAGCE